MRQVDPILPTAAQVKPLQQLGFVPPHTAPNVLQSFAVVRQSDAELSASATQSPFGQSLGVWQPL